MAELAGASEDQIRRLGRWNNQSMENCYLTSLPREAIRSLAGFPPAQGSFFLPRATVEPPDSLKRLIFPAIEPTLEKISSGAFQDSIPARGFLELLDRCRTVILQDSVLMMAEHPKHPIWNHAVFDSQLYRQFMQELQQSLKVSSDPTESVLQKAMPTLSQTINSMHADLKSVITNTVHPLAQSLAGLQASIGDVLSGRIPVYINAANGKAEVAVAAVAAAPVSEDDVSPIDQSFVAEDRADPRKITYRMSRGIKTVPDLWREWREGLTGGSAIKDLEAKCGTKWCEGNERRFFNRRKRIADEIVRIAEAMGGGDLKANAITAANVIEQDRIRKGKSLS